MDRITEIKGNHISLIQWERQDGVFDQTAIDGYIRIAETNMNTCIPNEINKIVTELYPIVSKENSTLQSEYDLGNVLFGEVDAKAKEKCLFLWKSRLMGDPHN